MKKILGLVLLLALPMLSYGQARNTGFKIRLKGPIYQDAVLLIHKNLVQVRTEVPFYLISYSLDRYKNTPSTPTLLGLRYERLGASDIGLGFDLEYCSYQAYPTQPKIMSKGEIPSPKDQEVIKFAPYIKKYIRTNRKAIFRGLYISGGLTYLSVKQVVDPNKVALGKGANEYFTHGDLLGASVGLGIQHTIGEYFCFGIGAEAILTSEQFQQETWIEADIGNGAAYLNAFKFYMGAHF